MDRNYESGAATDHVAAFFQDRTIFVFSDNLGYSLLKNAWYQICGRHSEVFGRTPLHLVLWVNIAPGG